MKASKITDALKAFIIKMTKAVLARRNFNGPIFSTSYEPCDR